MLFVQGSRDAFGTPAELEPVMSSLGDRATLHVVSGGDHSFKVARAGQQGQALVHADVQQVITDWIAASVVALLDERGDELAGRAAELGRPFVRGIERRRE